MTARTIRVVLGSLSAGGAAFTGFAASAQTLGQATGPEISWWRVIGALVFCCLLGVAGALALKYRMRRQGVVGKPIRFDAQVLSGLFDRFRSPPAREADAGARLKVIATVRLSYQVDVSLLESDGKTVMIVTSPQGAFVVNPDVPSAQGTKP
jgi:hypothetical protein